MNNTSNNIIKRQLLIINYLLESNYVSTVDIQNYLKQNGIDTPVRNIQRDLKQLEELLPLEVRKDDKPYSWRWQRLSETKKHNLTMSQALALTVVESELKGVIPDALYDSLSPLFVKAHYTTGLSQLDDGADVDTGIKMDVIQMSPLQRIIIHLRTHTLLRRKKHKPVIVQANDIDNKLTKDDKKTMKSLQKELKNKDLDVLIELLNGDK